MRVVACATAAKSCASWTSPAQSMAKPVPRHAMTSEWSPKIDNAWVARVRAATWRQNGSNSPAILYMFGIISSRPCDAVKVVAKDPACSAPWTVPAAPPSDWSCWTRGTAPHRFVRPAADHSSACSPMADAGVIG